MSFFIPVNDDGDLAELEKVAVSLSATGALVAADQNYKIRLVGGLLVASGGANTVTFTGDGNLTGAMSIPADGYLPLGFSARGVIDDTLHNTALGLTLTAATAVAGFIQFVRVSD